MVALLGVLLLGTNLNAVQCLADVSNDSELPHPHLMHIKNCNAL